MTIMDIPSWLPTTAIALVTGISFIVALRVNVANLKERWDERWAHVDQRWDERWALVDQRLGRVEHKIERVTPRLAELVSLRRDVEGIRDDVDDLWDERPRRRSRRTPTSMPAVPVERDSDEESGG